jgi:hypothetical protein
MWLSSGSSHPLFTTYALQGAVPRRTLDGFGKRLGVVSFGVLGVTFLGFRETWMPRHVLPSTVSLPLS